MRMELSKYDREYLEQRSKSSILTDDKTALMTTRELKNLSEYSTSLPTGTYIGKRWKRALYHKVGNRMVPSGKWIMGEFAPNPDPKTIDIVWRDIYLLDEENEIQKQISS